MSASNDFYQKILNPANIPLDAQFMDDMFKRYGIAGEIDLDNKNMEILQQAFIHKSYTKQKMNKYPRSDIEEINKYIVSDTKNVYPLQNNKYSYEVFEFRGDAFLGEVIVDYITLRYGIYEEEPVFYSHLKHSIERMETLNNISKSIGLVKYIILGKYKENIRESDSKILGDVFEALIGALLLITTKEIVSKFIITIIEKELNLAERIMQKTQYKKVVNAYCNEFDVECRYITNEIKDENGVPIFITKLKVGRATTEGSGQTQTRAEMDAAKQMTVYLDLKVRH